MAASGLARVDALAAVEHWSRSHTIRQLVREAFAARDAKSRNLVINLPGVGAAAGPSGTVRMDLYDRVEDLPSGKPGPPLFNTEDLDHEPYYETE
jgi:hypothetical protein